MATSGAPNQMQSAPVVIAQAGRGPGCLVQALWFLFVGWWLGGIVISLAWILNLTIIGLPLGMALLNGLPKIIALQEPMKTVVAVSQGGVTTVRKTDAPQHNFWLRTAFFLLIGWWWSGIWLALAYAVCATIILIPVGLEIIRWTPAMTTLRRY
jgi:uncharacterized membrane protein YccF (DUF307 family)